MDLTIVRSEWYRGKGSYKSRLRNAEGKQCCLGFFAKACGFTDAQIRLISTLGSLLNYRHNPNYLDAVPYAKEVFAQMIRDETSFIACNDDEVITDAAREAKLAEHFKARGVNVTFVD